MTALYSLHPRQLMGAAEITSAAGCSEPTHALMQPVHSVRDWIRTRPFGSLRRIRVQRSQRENILIYSSSAAREADILDGVVKKTRPD